MNAAYEWSDDDFEAEDAAEQELRARFRRGAIHTIVGLTAHLSPRAALGDAEELRMSFDPTLDTGEWPAP